MKKIVAKCNHHALMLTLIQISILTLLSIIWMHQNLRDAHEIRVIRPNKMYISGDKSGDKKLEHEIKEEQMKLSTLPPMTYANCSIAWRKQYQIPAKFINFSNITNDLIPNAYGWYQISKIPRGTFTYWLLQENTQNVNKIESKAYFADKFKVKMYIEQYKREYPQFNTIYYAKILHDFDNGNPSFRKLKKLFNNHPGFLLKPNHFSGKQMIINNFTKQTYRKIINHAKHWIGDRYIVMDTDHKINREPWYVLIRPHIFIEENIGEFTEYKFMVINYHVLFCYCYQGNSYTPIRDTINLYSLPDWKFLNVRMGAFTDRDHSCRIPSKENLDIMIKFAEHFATREKFRFVRVDLYESKDTIYFSEFTFSPNSGKAVISPIQFDYLLYNILCDNNKDDIDEIYKYVTYRDKEVVFKLPKKYLNQSYFN